VEGTPNITEDPQLDDPLASPHTRQGLTRTPHQQAFMNIEMSIMKRNSKPHGSGRTAPKNANKGQSTAKQKRTTQTGKTAKQRAAEEKKLEREKAAEEKKREKEKAAEEKKREKEKAAEEKGLVRRKKAAPAADKDDGRAAKKSKASAD